MQLGSSLLLAGTHIVLPCRVEQQARLLIIKSDSRSSSNSSSVAQSGQLAGGRKRSRLAQQAARTASAAAGPCVCSLACVM
jgi:hypothetical protein